MFGLINRHRLDESTRDEFEKLMASLRQFLSVAHHEDGTLSVGEWQDYGVLWLGTGVDIGDGQLLGRYARVGRTVYFNILLAAGSTTNFGTGGSWKFSVPLPARERLTHGVATAYDSSAFPGTYPGVAVVSGGDVGITPITSDGTWTSSVPFTWASGDFLGLSGFYELAKEVA